MYNRMSAVHRANVSVTAHDQFSALQTCDAGAGLGEKILCSKSQVYPILGESRIPPP